MAIKWYRGAASKRVLTPRRDKPKGPKQLLKKKPKKLGKPKSPGVIKPYIRIPFISAMSIPAHKRRAGQVMPNASLGGLAAVINLARINDAVIDMIEWKYSDSGREEKDKHECRSVTKGSPERICETLDGEKWEGDDALINFQDFAASQYNESKRTDGLWAVSHVNCTCTIKISMRDPSGAHASFYVSPARTVNILGYEPDLKDPNSTAKLPNELDADTVKNLGIMVMTEDPEELSKLRAVYDSMGNYIFNSREDIDMSMDSKMILEKLKSYEDPKPIHFGDPGESSEEEEAEVAGILEREKVVMPAPAPAGPKPPATPGPTVPASAGPAPIAGAPLPIPAEPTGTPTVPPPAPKKPPVPAPKNTDDEDEGVLPKEQP